jgi:uncharacterized protein (DUF2147 family)
MAAEPFASIRIGERFQYPASTTTPDGEKRPHSDQGSERPRKPTPEQAKVDPKAPAPDPAPNDQAPSPVIAPTNAPSAPAPTANVEPADGQAVPLQTPQAPTTSMAQSTTTPLGLWLTAEKESKVRIEQSGANLCGYTVDAKSNQNGEQVLINMKLGNDAKWSGRILDPNTGSTYDSTIALQGSDTLRIQGCAMSGMFCGGQTWSRLN